MADTPVAQTTPQTTPQAAVADAPSAHVLIGQQSPLLKPIPQDKVGVVAPSGEVGLIDATQVPSAKEAGYRPATVEELRHQQVKETYGDTSGEIASAALGLIDTATFGTGPGIMYKGAEILGGPTRAAQMKQGIEGLREANPSATLIGQGVGLVVPMALGPGGVLGEGIAGGIAEAVGGGVLGSAAKWAAIGGTEAALSGAGMAFSETELGDQKDLAEKMMAGAGKSFLYGAGIGGGLGLLGGSLARLGDRVKLPSAAQLSDNLMADSLHMTVEDLEHLETIGIDKQRLGAMMNREPALQKWALGGRVDKDFVDIVKGIYARDHEALDGMLTTIETAGEHEWSARNVVQRSQEVVKEIEKSPMFSTATKRVQKLIDEFGLKTGVLQKTEEGALKFDEVTGLPSMLEGKVTPKELHSFKSSLEEIIAAEGKTPAAKRVSDELRKMRDIMDQELAKGEQAQAYTDAAQKASISGALVDVGEKAARRLKTGFSLKDVVAGGYGYGYMGPKGIAFALGSKIVRERGNQFAAQMIRQSLQLGALKGAGAMVSDRALRAANAMVRGTIRVSSVALSRDKEYDKASKKVMELAANPEYVQNLTKDHVPDIAPGIQRMYIDANNKALQYLASIKPMGTAMIPILPGMATTRPTKAATTKWLKAYDVYNDPIGTIQAAMLRGQLTKDHVDAADVIYPALMKEIRQQTLMALANVAQSGKMPAYNKRLQLGLLMRAPTDASLQPDFINTQQQLINQPYQEDTYEAPQGGGVAQRSKPSDTNEGGGEEGLDKS